MSSTAEGSVTPRDTKVKVSSPNRSPKDSPAPEVMADQLVAAVEIRTAKLNAQLVIGFACIVRRYTELFSMANTKCYVSEKFLMCSSFIA